MRLLDVSFVCDRIIPCNLGCLQTVILLPPYAAIPAWMLGSYSEVSGKSLGFEQRGDTIWILFGQICCGCCVEKSLY